MRVAIITTDLRDDHRRYEDPEPSFGAAPTALLQGFAMQQECEVHVISCVQKPVNAPRMTFGNLFYHAVHVGKWGWLRGGYIGCVTGIRQKLREIQPDLVHGQGTERYCSLSAVYSGFPNVLTIHGNMGQVARFMKAKPLSFHWLTARLENLALRKTQGVFCNSEYTRQTVQSRTRQAWIVPNAIRSVFFAPTTQESATPPKLLNIGTVIPYKCQVEILTVCERLFERGYRFTIHFAGGVDHSSTYGKRFLEMVQRAEKMGFARYLEFLHTPELVTTIDSGSALIHCPREEAFGLVVAEALARNLKFFGMRTGGVPEVASGAEGAELFEMDDWTGLEMAIAKWLEDGSKRPTNATATMAARFHPKRVAARHVEIYQEVLSRAADARCTQSS